MKKTIFMAVFGITLLASANFAEAKIDKGGLFIEPYITYENSDYEVDYPAPLNKSEGDYIGAGLGARLGFHVLESIFVGVDGRYNKYSFNDDEADFETDATGYTYGTVVGLQLPTEISLRVWWNWILDGVIDPEESDNLDLKFEDASGHRVGVGIMIGTISLNAEYQDITYSEMEIEKLGPFSGRSNDSELENKGYVFSVSFPYAL